MMHPDPSLNPPDPIPATGPFSGTLYVKDYLAKKLKNVKLTWSSWESGSTTAELPEFWSLAFSGTELGLELKLIAPPAVELTPSSVVSVLVLEAAVSSYN